MNNFKYITLFSDGNTHVKECSDERELVSVIVNEMGCDPGMNHHVEFRKSKCKIYDYYSPGSDRVIAVDLETLCDGGCVQDAAMLEVFLSKALGCKSSRMS